MPKNFEIIEEYGTCLETKKGKVEQEYLELKLVKWYDKATRLDLRWWSESGQPLKGVTFTAAGAEALRKVLEDMNYEL